jgi:hypothetical protein
MYKPLKTFRRKEKFLLLVNISGLRQRIGEVALWGRNEKEQAA